VENTVKIIQNKSHSSTVNTAGPPPDPLIVSYINLKGLSRKWTQNPCPISVNGRIRPKMLSVSLFFYKRRSQTQKNFTTITMKTPSS